MGMLVCRIILASQFLWENICYQLQDQEHLFILIFEIQFWLGSLTFELVGDLSAFSDEGSEQADSESKDTPLAKSLPLLNRVRIYRYVLISRTRQVASIECCIDVNREVVGFMNIKVQIASIVLHFSFPRFCISIVDFALSPRQRSFHSFYLVHLFINVRPLVTHRSQDLGIFRIGGSYSTCFVESLIRDLECSWV